jgi:hypothetical protein|nr:hypothetical protein [uncultured bacterium]
MAETLDKNDVTETVAAAARMICAEQPDVPEPASIADLDSFSMVQIVLELENIYHVRLLELIEEFDGAEFSELADVIMKCVARDQ